MKWCAHASNHALGRDEKPWRYALIPHDEIAANVTLDALTAQFCR